MAKGLAETEYEEFNQKRIQEKDCIQSDFHKTIRYPGDLDGKPVEKRKD